MIQYKRLPDVWDKLKSYNLFFSHDGCFTLHWFYKGFSIINFKVKGTSVYCYGLKFEFGETEKDIHLAHIYYDLPTEEKLYAFIEKQIEIYNNKIKYFKMQKIDKKLEEIEEDFIEDPN